MNCGGEEQGEKKVGPCSAKIFLLDGDPNGIRIAGIPMSAIEAIAFPRTHFASVRNRGRQCENFPDIERVGVYLLIGVDGSNLECLSAYIGESESVGRRLYQHISERGGRKDFWTDTIALFAGDNSLTKSHIRYAEQHLLKAADGVPRWDLKCDVPASQRKVPYTDLHYTDKFISETKILVGALGWDLFSGRGKQSPEEESASEEELVLSAKGKGNDYEATMTVHGRNFVVHKGSKAWKRPPEPAMPSGYVELRRMLLEKKILREEGNFYVFSEDYAFTSSTAAGAIVKGSHVSGPLFWKLPDGRTYAKWEAAETSPD